MAKLTVYVSEPTQFIRELLATRPHLAEEQRKARARWWDRPVDTAEQAQFAQGRVRQKAYVYQTRG